MKNIIYITLLVVLVGVLVVGQKEKLTATPNETTEIIQEVTPEASSTEESLIVVSTPVSGARVGDPLEVFGQARGYWFFEATAPVVVTDWDGLIIGEGYITAEGDWMTETYVPFSGTIDYTLPADAQSTTGTVIFKRANPSGLLENDATHEVQVQLTAT